MMFGKYLTYYIAMLSIPVHGAYAWEEFTREHGAEVSLAVATVEAGKRIEEYHHKPRISLFVNRALKQEKAQSYTSPITGCEGIECFERYVSLPDASYSWHDTGLRINGTDPSSGVGWLGYIINMTSQTWVTGSHPEFPVWWHTLVVIIPDNLANAGFATLCPEFGMDTEQGTAAFFVNREIGHPSGFHAIDANTLEASLPSLSQSVWKSAKVATRTRAVAASLFSVLDEAQIFGDDPTHMVRYQDDIKAYTWEDFLLSGASEPERIIELPLAKAAVRAMDTITSFTTSLLDGGITRFGVWGFSKLGSLTWAMGAIDPRVEIILPTAIMFQLPDSSNASLLQVTTEAAQNPYDFLDHWRGTPEFARCEQIVNWMSFASRQTKPKLFTMDTNDEWFGDMATTWQFTWRVVPEPKSLLFKEGHHGSIIALASSEATAFIAGFLQGNTTPAIDYTYDNATGIVRVTQVTSHVPTSVELHSAMCCNDACWETNVFTSEDVTETCSSSNTWDVSAVPQDPILYMSIEFGVCSRVFFVRFSYDWPTPGVDTFGITTPLYLWSAGN